MQAAVAAGGGAGAGAASPALTMDKFTAYLEFPSGGSHTFFEKNGGATFLDPALEQIDIPQIFDKYPGLRELYHTGPTHAFFLVKFWVDLHYDVLPQRCVDVCGVSLVVVVPLLASYLCLHLVSSSFAVGHACVSKTAVSYEQPC